MLYVQSVCICSWFSHIGFGLPLLFFFSLYPSCYYVHRCVRPMCSNVSVLRSEFLCRCRWFLASVKFVVKLLFLVLMNLPQFSLECGWTYQVFFFGGEITPCKRNSKCKRAKEWTNMKTKKKRRCSFSLERKVTQRCNSIKPIWKFILDSMNYGFTFSFTLVAQTSFIHSIFGGFVLVTLSQKLLKADFLPLPLYSMKN